MMFQWWRDSMGMIHFGFQFEDLNMGFFWVANVNTWSIVKARLSAQGCSFQEIDPETKKPRA